MPRKTEHIGLQLPGIYRHLAGRLRRIDHEQQPVPVRNLPDPRNIQHIAGQIRGMRRRDQPRLRRNCPLEIRIIDPAKTVRLHNGQPDALPLKLIQRPQHRIMLELRGDRVIARF